MLPAWSQRGRSVAAGRGRGTEGEAGCKPRGRVGRPGGNQRPDLVAAPNCTTSSGVDPFAVLEIGGDGLGMGKRKKRSSALSSATAPDFSGVLETSLYVDDLDAAERFYAEVLGLPKILSVPGRQLTFRCQESVLLLFNPRRTEREQVVINGGTIPRHGARGPGHVAFRVAKRELEAWRQHFRAVGVVVESEVSWPTGAHSIYFRDPAGNSLELATPDLWTRAEP